jgi:uncharacterized protein
LIGARSGRVAVAFVAGALFGVGLVVSGMTRPVKVIGFLDFAGAWDPSLMWVMAGAVGVHLLFFQLVYRRRNPRHAASLPPGVGVDRRLVGGAALFGVGWGTAGFCPGPALVALGSSSVKPLVFVAAMLAGIKAQQWLGRTSRAALTGGTEAAGWRLPRA